MTDNELKEHCLQEAGIDLGRYSYNEMSSIKDALRRYNNAKLKLLSIADVSGECLHPYNSVRTDKITELSKCSICEKEWY